MNTLFFAPLPFTPPSCKIACVEALRGTTTVPLTCLFAGSVVTETSPGANGWTPTEVPCWVTNRPLEKPVKVWLCGGGGGGGGLGEVAGTWLWGVDAPSGLLAGVELLIAVVRTLLLVLGGRFWVTVGILTG